jgi:hypothetical protein
MVVKDPCMRGHITAARKHVNNTGENTGKFALPATRHQRRKTPQQLVL